MEEAESLSDVPSRREALIDNTASFCRMRPYQVWRAELQRASSSQHLKVSKRDTLRVKVFNRLQMTEQDLPTTKHTDYRGLKVGGSCLLILL